MAVDGTMFVIGGRSTTAEFKDMFVLDTEVDPPVWTEVREACSSKKLTYVRTKRLVPTFIEIPACARCMSCSRPPIFSSIVNVNNTRKY